jgi:hypothetical protein
MNAGRTVPHGYRRTKSDLAGSAFAFRDLGQIAATTG